MSQLYPQGAAHILGKTTQADLDSDTFKILLYAGSFNGAHEFVSDLTGGSVVARSPSLTGVTVTAGVVDANDVTITAVSGSAFAHIVLYKDTGTDSSSVLIASFDVASFTPTGADVSIVWSPSGLFSIA